MKKTFELLISSIVIAFTMFFSACEYYEIDHKTGSYTSFDILRELKDKSDGQGNLEVNNMTNFRYLLYVNDSLTRLIPANANKHLIHIPTSGARTFNLKVFIRTDLLNHELLSPPASKVFLQWDVVLPRETWENVRINWIIDDIQQNEEATVNFLYPNNDGLGNINPHNVDVFLNSSTGAKLISLAPGGTTANSIAFGYQVLLFRYWKSNPANPGIQEEIGWVKQKPNGTAYGLVLNSFNEIIDFTIPAFFEIYPHVSGKLKLINNTDYTVFIRANGQKLEDFIILDEGSSTTGLSFINEHSESPEYRVPIGEYLLKAIIPNSGAEYASKVLYIEEGIDYSWEIE